MYRFTYWIRSGRAILWSRGLEITGIHLGDWQGTPPMGKRFTVSGLAMRHITDGKSVERWYNLDWLSAYQQHGLIPAG